MVNEQKNWCEASQLKVARGVSIRSLCPTHGLRHFEYTRFRKAQGELRVMCASST